MVAPLEYSNSILRSAWNGNKVGANNEALDFDAALADVIAQESQKQWGASAGAVDAYSTLMAREDQILEGLNKRANDRGGAPHPESKWFMDMSIAEVMVEMLNTMRALVTEVITGHAHAAIALIVLDPNTRVFAGMWIGVAALVMWAINA